MWCLSHNFQVFVFCGYYSPRRGPEDCFLPTGTLGSDSEVVWLSFSLYVALESETDSSETHFLPLQRKQFRRKTKIVKKGSLWYASSSYSIFWWLQQEHVPKTKVSVPYAALFSKTSFIMAFEGMRPFACRISDAACSTLGLFFRNVPLSSYRGSCAPSI